MNSTTVIPTDLVTPLGAYLRLREQGGAAFLLESVEHGRLGRHSFVGCGTELVSFEEAESRPEPVVGYLAYDHAATLEPTVPLPAAGPAAPGEPVRRRRHARPLRPRTRLRRGALGRPGRHHSPAGRAASGAAWPRPAARATCAASPPASTTSEDVRRAIDHIRAGDAFQIVLSQRAERPTAAGAIAVYRTLRRINPSPYNFLLDLGDISLVGSSPETLVKLDGRRASVNPIAGTVRRGPGDVEKLLASEKDRAEHVMLVDLGRNDLSRVCEAGSVKVVRFLEAERFSHVTHLVSEVAGTLRDGVAPFDLLRACFPAGTVSGAPKVRAMQIISELEGYRRGPYAGAVGYRLPDGSLDTCIAIRTIVLHDGVAYLQAGAGIVADSSPHAEHEECLRKLAALETALNLAEAAR